MIRVDMPVPLFRATLALPPKVLRPNGSFGNWRGSASAAKAYRKDAAYSFGYAATLATIDEPLKAATVRATFYYPTNRNRDRDNAAASLKRAWDGMEDAGVIENDKQLTHLPPRLRVDKALPRVEIELWNERIEFYSPHERCPECSTPDTAECEPPCPRAPVEDSDYSLGMGSLR